MPSTGVRGARILAVVALGAGALAFGPAAGVAGAATAATPTVLSSGGRSHYAYPQRAAVVRATASRTARRVGTLHFLTEDGQAEVYVALARVRVAGVTWIRVSLPKRPNGVTGWVAASALGPLHLVRGRLVVNRTTLRATLYDGGGKAIWSARAGVGRASLPTPAGRFYVREKLRTIGGPEYGPFAIGTSAYASSLSDWPGGGVVGLHGTNEPNLIPGRPSHGCVRLRNADVTRLWHLIRVGTPIEIV